MSLTNLLSGGEYDTAVDKAKGIAALNSADNAYSTGQTGATSVGTQASGQTQEALTGTGLSKGDIAAASQQSGNVAAMNAVGSETQKAAQKQQEALSNASTEVQDAVEKAAGVGDKIKSTGTGAATGAASGAMLGSVVPGIGTGIGALAGGLLGGLAGFFSDKDLKCAEKISYKSKLHHYKR